LIYGSKPWPTKVTLDRNKMTVIRWICSFMLKERKKNTELSELIKLELVRLVIKMCRLRWFGHAEREDNGAGSSYSVSM